MTIKEIKDNLGVDITQKNRQPVYSVLRGLYVEHQFKVLNHLKPSEIPRIICVDINCDRTNIYNYLKKVKNYKFDVATKLIVKAFNTQEKKYIDEYYAYLKKQKDIYNRRFKNDIFIKQVESGQKIIKPVIPVKPKVIKQMNNLQVANFLKANKIFKDCKYWDKMITKYTDEDWAGLRKINPKMFDDYLK
jgi:hypothetical protein